MGLDSLAAFLGEVHGRLLTLEISENYRNYVKWALVIAANRMCLSID
ncbi:hypothetical protein KTQ74_24050 [Pseudomonas chlororaphis]|nr:hypothetical protein [Pseudomonas chlororaphis]MCB2254998.1 hypothetical protein [Pseudomonas chlororaphis]